MKRLSSRWMGRAAFTYNNWKEHVGPGAIINPSHTDLDPQIDGAQHVEFAVGSGKNYYTSAKWQVNVNGMYQMPGGFEVAANLFGRQGYPKPVYLQLDLGALDGAPNVLAVNTTDQIRLKNLWDLDLRLAKSLRFGSTNLTLAGEIFNVLNANTELYRNPNATSCQLQSPGRDPRAAHRTRERPVHVLESQPYGPGARAPGPFPMSRSRRRSRSSSPPPLGAGCPARAVVAPAVGPHRRPVRRRLPRGRGVADAPDSAGHRPQAGPRRPARHHRHAARGRCRRLRSEDRRHAAPRSPGRAGRASSARPTRTTS